MNNQVSFGKYEGQTFEWLFFKDPQYVKWMIESGIPHQEHFGEEEGAYFTELHRRASNLAGPCPRCGQPIARMGLTTRRRGELSAVGFYCEDCAFQGGSCTGYHPASFFVEAYTLEKWEQRMVQSEIQRLYIPGERLTQKKMEEFFRNDAHFSDCTPGFFREEVTA